MEMEALLDWIGAHVVRYSQSAVRITGSDGKVIDFDPLGLPRTAPPADLILISHDHPDHFSPREVRRLTRPGTLVAVPSAVRKAGRDQGLATDDLAPGESRVLGSWTLSALPAYNLKAPMHPRSQGYVGWVLTLDGLKIYHAGDTDRIPEMAGLAPDIAFLPVGGGLVTMGAVQAAEAADILGARVVIPIHYGRIPFTGGAGRKLARRWSGITELLGPGCP